MLGRPGSPAGDREGGLERSGVLTRFFGSSNALATGIVGVQVMMEPMERDAYAAGTGSGIARLHLHRGPGVFYGAMAVAVLTGVVAGVAAYLGTERIVMAVVTAIVGLGVTAFLALLSFSIVVPALDATGTGIAGRLAWGRTVDTDWTGVTIDVDHEAPPGRFRLDIDDESIEITRRSWLGFDDFVILVASTSAAAHRLTPAARHEVARLLQIEDR